MRAASSFCSHLPACHRSATAGERDMQCYHIDYFPREEYSPDPNDSTMAIPYAVTKSAVFFFLATVILFAAEFCCLFGHLARHRRLFTFISGVLCIVSGLLMLIGLVMYISIFKAEIGSKLRPRSQLQPPLFTYRYGFSFLLVVSGFMSTEVAGTCAIFLYIYWHQLEWGRQGRHKIPASCVLLDQHASYPPACRRHPPPPAPTFRPCMHASPSLHRRYYLERAGDAVSVDSSPCPARSHLPIAAVAGSLCDISLSSSLYHLPPAGAACPHYYPRLAAEELCGLPPALGSPARPPCRHGSAVSFPRDATTNTVSTTADINSCGGEGALDDEDGEYSPSLQHENEFVTFDMDDQPAVPPLPARPLVEDALRRKEFGLDALRRTTPV
ncbi:uncharacterized protein LOC134531644 isoform X2 [Bacillus rossius redtenbacheri]|uniref:uncharacterized protein LOC134531644 isoform X2 n=1 Tax=Bacillus rossius redtenbacheri TaxID=93214 RepID=UPI002FDDF1B2